MFTFCFWQYICEMLFFLVCLLFCPSVPCCTRFWRQAHLDPLFICSGGRVKDTLEFQQLQWSDFKTDIIMVSGNIKRCSLWTHEVFLKEHNTSVLSSGRSFLPSRGQMFVAASTTNPAALLLHDFLYTVVQPWIKAQTLSIFIDFYSVPSAHCTSNI